MVCVWNVDMRLHIVINVVYNEHLMIIVRIEQLQTKASDDSWVNLEKIDSTEISAQKFDFITQNSLAFTFFKTIFNFFFKFIFALLLFLDFWK